jgi:hypothetical protein
MAHFAKINEDGVVQDIIVVANEDCAGGDYPESESHGQDFIAALGIPGTWKQTSYSKSFRKDFAQPGFLFLAEPDVFVEPRPHASWSLNSSYDWVAPVAKPEDGQHYLWNEEKQQWDLDASYHFENEFID